MFWVYFLGISPCAIYCISPHLVKKKKKDARLAVQTEAIRFGELEIQGIKRAERLVEAEVT